MKKILILLTTALLIISCGPKQEMIPSDVMKKIITQTLITNAMLNTVPGEGGAAPIKNSDSLDYYRPILEYFGYTLNDFRYTISEMSSRKSNPLNNILEEVAKEMESVDAVAEARYQALMEIDKMALREFADTVYAMDTTIIGKLNKYKIFIEKPLRGKYRLTGQYKSVSNYSVGGKSITYRFAGNDPSTVKGVKWLSMGPSEDKIDLEMANPRQGFDSLYIEFIDSKAKIEYIDTSYIKNIMLVYTPETEVARRNFYIKKTGFTPLNELYEKRYFSAQDSLPISLYRAQ